VGVPLYDPNQHVPITGEFSRQDHQAIRTPGRCNLNSADSAYCQIRPSEVPTGHPGIFISAALSLGVTSETDVILLCRSRIFGMPPLKAPDRAHSDCLERPSFQFSLPLKAEFYGLIPIVIFNG
jgi:hypothetical protein